jgi:hypothetical protein
VPLAAFLNRPVVFELQGLGDDQKRFFCLYVLQYLLLLRKHDTRAREVLQHVLIFDEGHNVFPKDQYGEHSVPSRLAREVREYGEAIIAATQQTDVSDSLIANSGTKIILRTDFPRDVEFASRLLHVDPKWLPRLPLGTGIVRSPTRYYQPFIFTFAEQPQKNVLVTDEAITERFDSLGQVDSAHVALALALRLDHFERFPSLFEFQPGGEDLFEASTLKCGEALGQGRAATLFQAGNRPDHGVPDHFCDIGASAQRLVGANFRPELLDDPGEKTPPESCDWLAGCNPSHAKVLPPCDDWCGAPWLEFGSQLPGHRESPAPPALPDRA